MPEPNETGSGGEQPAEPLPQKPTPPDIFQVQAGEPIGDPLPLELPDEIQRLLNRMPPGELPPGML